MRWSDHLKTSMKTIGLTWTEQQECRSKWEIFNL